MASEARVAATVTLAAAMRPTEAPRAGQAAKMVPAVAEPRAQEPAVPRAQTAQLEQAVERAPTLAPAEALLALRMVVARLRWAGQQAVERAPTLAAVEALVALWVMARLRWAR